MSSAKIGESLDSATPQLDYLDSPAGSHAIVVGDEREAEPDVPGRGGAELIDMPRKVLLVEPSSGERWWLRNELISAQMEVFEANDLIMALRAIPMFQPNAILAQMRLPTYGGLELVRRLKGESKTQSIPILLYADVATAEERVRAFDLGAVDFVSKPFVGAELLARVRAALRTRHLLTMLEQRAHLDGLTGLANRGVLEDRLPREWEACRRRGTSLAVVISDLDHFKSINDNHGHASGDEVLRQSAARLGRVVRSSDLVARYGGEEFVVVAPDCELHAAVKLADRFRTAIAQLGVVEHGVAIPVTTSVGVAATSDLARIPPAQLLKQADEALYRAKDSGRDATWFWDQDRGPLPAAELLGEGES
ncbi:MAG: diguanylate cyclase [Planctomycetaceae bacterium]|nr:diguanylate cyclase [Planctomycetaceae bacterium]